MLTAQGSEQAAVEALKSGAADYVVKSDVTLADMARIARRSVREWQARAELERARERVHEAQRLARDILDSLPSPIALLDRSGVIRSVNEAWNDSQQPPGLYGAECTVGRDYPSFCRDRGFPEIAAILEETLGQPVLASRAEYSCDSNHEARYIQLCIKPFVGDGQGRAIVMHLDVTAQRRDEAEAKQLAEALRRTQALSRRQMQVLKKMVEGCSNKDIASQLNVSIKTVEMHRANAIKALSASNSTEAVRIALSAFPSGESVSREDQALLPRKRTHAASWFPRRLCRRKSCPVFQEGHLVEILGCNELLARLRSRRIPRSRFGFPLICHAFELIGLGGA
ncbi:MAG: LuxR C-terminal-related transcriptional regulator [Pirellulaceae bacterium]